VRALRRLVFVLVIAGLVAAVPVSAIASDNLLRSDVQQTGLSFKQALAEAVRGGFDSEAADRLMWRFIIVDTTKPDAWWEAAVVQHDQLDKLRQLQSDLQDQYQQQISENRQALQRQFQRWDQMLGEAGNAGVSAEGLDTHPARFMNYAALASTPSELVALSTVLDEQFAILDARMAAYRTARAQVDAAAQNARALLASARQYPQLNLAGFQDQITAGSGGLEAVHSAEAFGPKLTQLQQAAAGIQGLLNARGAAYNQLADTRSTLATAQKIGALVGNRAGIVNSLAGQIDGAADRGTFQSLTSQLYAQKQALATAIYMKQMSPVSYNAGVGKLIVISLSRQVLTAYQDGTAVMTTYVATGRPALPTPPGVYHIFHRYAPYKMISPWAYGSPYWYPDSWTNWAMEFAGGGYFIHDAPWRSWYGPGSNTYNGTHGCVNVPYSQMAFLWNWTPMGTTVVVQY
jgi:lipoprotein-anchoring transpeptidase ErfK/SrfK